MNYSYYTINDLRLGHDPKGITGWRLCRFLCLDRALEHYQKMPATGLKCIGMTDGLHVLELARCHPLLPGDTVGEDVLAGDYHDYPLWRDIPEAAEAVETCITALRLRYRLEEQRVVPLPSHGQTPQDVQLRPDHSGGPLPSVLMAYVVGEGLIPPEKLKRPRATLPLVLSYQTECVTGDGVIGTLDLSPWEYDQIAQRSKTLI